jgi:hypothetical protein
MGSTEIVFQCATASPPIPSIAAPTGPGGTAHLEVRSGPAVGLAFALAQSPAQLGRVPASDICIDDVSVSARHAVLFERSGAWLLADQGSTNGTFWRGERLAPGREIPLQEGDMFTVGQVAIVFSSRKMATAMPPSGWNAPPSAAPRGCIGCGQPLAQGARFCNACGFPVPAGAS